MIRHFHELDVPVEVLVIDWQHWHYLGDWSFWQSECWPDPTAMVKEISSYGTHTMISAWPRVDPHSSHYAEMSALKLLTTRSNGSELMSADGSGYIYDAFNPAAREYVWNALLAGYVSHGIQLFWLDAAEPEQSRPGLQWWNGHSDLEVGMAWVIQHQLMIFEGSLSSGIHEDQIIQLVRHGWVGSSLSNSFIWSGDVQSSWESLQVQVKVAPNVQLSGLHWWATDIGGYFGGHFADADFNELLVRWFQWGAFLPIFRTHGHREPSEENEPLCGGGGGPNELWIYQHEAEIRAIIALRELIRPYVEYHLLQASLHGVPILQPMWSAAAAAAAAHLTAKHGLSQPPITHSFPPSPSSPLSVCVGTTSRTPPASTSLWRLSSCSAQPSSLPLSSTPWGTPPLRAAALCISPLCPQVRAGCTSTLVTATRGVSPFRATTPYRHSPCSCAFPPITRTQASLTGSSSSKRSSSHCSHPNTRKLPLRRARETSTSLDMEERVGGDDV